MQRTGKKTAGKYRLYCNLGYNLSEDAVRSYFQQLCTHGQILDVYIPRHNSGRNKGYGFTTFESEEDLNYALQSPEHIVDSIIVKINRAGPRPEYEAALRKEGQDGEHISPAPPLSQQVQQHGKGPRLYVGGIPDDVTEEEIKIHFGRWGNVVDIYFPGKKGQKRVNYCFVTFDNWRAAQRSCNQSERTINGRPLQSISMAEERTVDARETPANLLLPQDGPAGPSFGPASGHWTQDLQDYSLLSALQHASGLGTVAPSNPFLGLSSAQNQAAAPQNLQPHPGVAKLEESLSEQLLLRSIDSGSVAEQDAFLAAQQVHADFQAQLQGQFEPYPLPPSALQDLHAGVQNLSLSSASRGDLTGAQLAEMTIPQAYASLQGNLQPQQQAWAAAEEVNEGFLPSGYQPRFFGGQQLPGHGASPTAKSPQHAGRGISDYYARHM